MTQKKATAALSNSAPREVDEITLEGRKVRVWNIDLPLHEVQLDAANPRIANSVSLSSTNSGRGNAGRARADPLGRL